MLKATLIRLKTNEGEDNPTLGVLYIEGVRPLCTLELPWKRNQRGLSCIPDGTYTCEKAVLHRTIGGMLIPKTYEVMQVPDRDGILFHVGNYPTDTMGCILVGTNHAGQVLENSRAGFDAFLAACDNANTFSLTVLWT